MQKIEELQEIMYMYMIDSSSIKLKFQKIKDFQENFGLFEYFKKNPYYPKNIKKNYKFIEMIKDAPILA